MKLLTRFGVGVLVGAIVILIGQQSGIKMIQDLSVKAPNVTGAIQHFSATSYGAGVLTGVILILVIFFWRKL